MKTYCVATAIIKNTDLYFVARRAQTKKIAPGKWEFITGFVEDHEAAEDTILREMKEEIGASGSIVQRLNIIQQIIGDEHWVVIPFLTAVTDIKITTKPSEHSEGRWVRWNELEKWPKDEFRYNIDLIDPTFKKTFSLY